MQIQVKLLENINIQKQNTTIGHINKEERINNIKRITV